MVVLPGEIRWLTGSRTHARTRGKPATGNRQARWIAAEAAVGNRQAQRTAEGAVGNRQVRWIAAVAVRIVSVTKAFPAEAAAELLAAGVEATVEAMREPAVHEDHPAWAPAAAGVVADGGGKQVMIKENHMSSNTFNFLPSRSLVAAQVVALSCALTVLGHAAPQSSQTAAAASQPAQMSFATPKQAAEALIQAAADYNVPALMGMFGPDGKDIVSTADAVRDKNNAASFAAEAHEKTDVVVDPKNPNRAILSVGNEEWPLPIPIVKKEGKWYFNTKAGLKEILYRRIGTNELDAITICRGFVEAQKDYAEQIHDDSGVNQYAQRIISTPGKQDGLAWQNPDGSWGGPVGEAAAKALVEGYGEKGKPFHGYYFKVLKGQGPDAPLGKLDYMIEGAMIGGFALVAVPAEYRVTGVKTFMVDYDGVVYQKDLGPDSISIVKNMELYNPDKTWRPTSDNW